MILSLVASFSQSMSPWELVQSIFQPAPTFYIFPIYRQIFSPTPKFLQLDFANDWARIFWDPSRVVASALLYRKFFLEFQVIGGKSS